MTMPSETRPASKGTILCVDDEADILQMIEALLRSEGYDPILGHGGQEGLELFRKYRKELVAVILDIRMPRMDGFQVAQEIRAQSPGIPLIALSAYLGGHDQTDALMKCQEAGFNAYATKPFSVYPFLDTLATWIESYKKHR